MVNLNYHDLSLSFYAIIFYSMSSIILTLKSINIWHYFIKSLNRKEETFYVAYNMFRMWKRNF